MKGGNGKGNIVVRGSEDVVMKVGEFGGVVRWGMKFRGDWDGIVRLGMKGNGGERG